MSAEALERFQAGDLRGAMETLVGHLKRHPADARQRLLYAELQAVAGDMERADRQLDTLAKQVPEAVAGVVTLRRLLRAEQSRQNLFDEGRLPNFRESPDAYMHDLMEALTMARDGAVEQAAELCARAESVRPRCSGELDGRAFGDLRDLDDLDAGVLEIYTDSGDYFRLPLHTVQSVEFRSPRRARDLIWREARLVSRDGLDACVWLPAVYAVRGLGVDAAHRTGSATDWHELSPDGPVLGMGQRMWLLDEEHAVPMMEAGRLDFGTPTEGTVA